MSLTADIKSFKRVFSDVVALWTSEDGNITDYVVKADNDVLAYEKIKAYLYENTELQMLADAVPRPMYMERRWCGHEWFDGASGVKRKKCWLQSHVKTPFMVWAISYWEDLESIYTLDREPKRSEARQC